MIILVSDLIAVVLVACMLCKQIIPMYIKQQIRGHFSKNFSFKPTDYHISCSGLYHNFALKKYPNMLYFLSFIKQKMRYGLDEDGLQD